MRNKGKIRAVPKQENAIKLKKPSRASLVGILMLSTFITCSLPTVEERLPAEIEQKIFWDRHLDKVISKDLLPYPSTFYIPEIRDRYNFLRKTISKRYARGIEFNCSTVFSPRSRNVAAGCEVREGIPCLRLFIPKQMEICEEFRQSGKEDWNEQFKLSVVVSIMHELEHLACDPSDDPKDTQTLEGLVFQEKIAWDSTCRYSIMPLIENHHFNMAGSHVLYYRAWIATGRDKDSPGWTKFLTDAYREARP